MVFNNVKSIIKPKEFIALLKETKEELSSGKEPDKLKSKIKELYEIFGLDRRRIESIMSEGLYDDSPLCILLNKHNDAQFVLAKLKSLYINVCEKGLYPEQNKTNYLSFFDTLIKFYEEYSLLYTR